MTIKKKVATKKKAPAKKAASSAVAKRQIKKVSGDRVTIRTNRKGYEHADIAVEGERFVVNLKPVGQEYDEVMLTVVLVTEAKDVQMPHYSHEAIYDFDTGHLIGYVRVAPESGVDTYDRIVQSLEQIAYELGVGELDMECARYPIIN